jgi:uncharacterized protein
MPIPKRKLGSTNVEVTALGLGGVCWNLVDDDADAVKVVHRAIDLGITYLDTASGYKESERRLGLALRDRDRDALFVATKCIKRSGDDAKRELDESFERLQVDTIDLVQIHAIDQEGSLDEALKPDGMLRLIEDHQKAGRIRFVGLTGHTHPEVFVRLISEYEFDAVLNPMGVVNRVWNDFSGGTIPAARARGMGVIGMKVMAYGKAPEADRSGYLRYTMGLPIDVAIVGMDTVDQVEENVRIAESFVPLTDTEERALLQRGLEFIPGAKEDLWWLPEKRVAS